MKCKGSVVVPSKDSSASPTDASSFRGCALACSPSAISPNTPAVPRSMCNGKRTVLTDGFETETALSSRQGHLLGARRGTRRCIAGAQRDALTRRCRGARCLATAAVAERETRIDVGREDLVVVGDVTVAHLQRVERRQRGRLCAGVTAFSLAELPRRTAVLQPFERSVELGRRERLDVQRTARQTRHRSK